MPTPQQRSGLILRGPVIGAAPAFRTPVATTAGSGVGVAANLPSGYLAGDLLFMAVALNAAITMSTPSGWALIRRTLVNAVDRNLYTLAKIATGSEGSTVALTFGSDQYAVAVAAYTGAASATPEAEDGQQNASSANCVAPSITTLGPNRLLIFAGCAGNRTFTPPTGYTERADIAGAATVAVTIAEATQAVAGATGTVTGTISSAITNGAHIAAFKGA